MQAITHDRFPVDHRFGSFSRFGVTFVVEGDPGFQSQGSAFGNSPLFNRTAGVRQGGDGRVQVFQDLADDGRFGDSWRQGFSR